MLDTPMCHIQSNPLQTHSLTYLSIMAEQQVNLTDLDLNQLQDVKKQLDSVSPFATLI